MIANSSLTSNTVDTAVTSLQLLTKPLDLNENDKIRTYPNPVADQSTVIDMAHISSQNEIAHDRDSEHDSSDQGSKKKGTRGSRFRSQVVLMIVHIHHHIFNREGKDKGPGRMSPNTWDYVSQSPTGEVEESQGVHPKDVPAMELPEATSRVIPYSDAPEPVPISDDPKVRAHPNNSGQQNRPGGHHGSHTNNTAGHSGANHPTHHSYAPPLNSAAGSTAYGLNGPYHQPNRPRLGLPAQEIAYFSGNHGRSDKAHIVGVKTSTSTASNENVLYATGNWVVEGNHNYGTGGQITGQEVLNGAQPKRHAGQFIGNHNFKGQHVVGLHLGQ